MKAALTDKQRQILEAIEQITAAEGRPPSITELTRRFGLASPNGMAKHLKALENKGYLDRKKGARGSVIAGSCDCSEVFQEAGIRHIPVVGTIAAGSPILADQNIETELSLPEIIAGTGESFLLRVKGDSMIEEGILSGDLVVIERCEKVANGEIAAVLVEDEATLKRFYQHGNRAVLEPANKDYEPIEVDLTTSSCAILGRLVSLIRSYRSRI